MENVQRLNGSGCKEKTLCLRYSLVPGEYPINRAKARVSTWLHIWNELTQSAGHQLGYANMVGNIPQLTNPVLNNGGSGPVEVTGQVLYVPLEFWFAKNPGLKELGQKSAVPIAICA